MSKFLSNFLNQVTSSAPAATTTPPANNQQQQQKAPDTTGDNSPLVQGQTTPNSQTPEPVKNPLDAFAGMWENKPNVEAAPKYSLPADKLGEVAKSMDFMQAVPPELMQKATAGDVGALMQAMNIVAQQAYQNSLAHGSQLTDQFVNSRLEYEGKGFDSKLTQSLAASELSNSVESFKHPVVKAQLTQIAKDLSKQYPDAPATEIAKMAQDYIKTMATAVLGNQESQGGGESKKPSSASETNWETYFS